MLLRSHSSQCRGSRLISRKSEYLLWQTQIYHHQILDSMTSYIFIPSLQWSSQVLLPSRLLCHKPFWCCIVFHSSYVLFPINLVILYVFGDLFSLCEVKFVLNRLFCEEYSPYWLTPGKITYILCFLPLSIESPLLMIFWICEMSLVLNNCKFVAVSWIQFLFFFNCEFQWFAPSMLWNTMPNTNWKWMK